jgi:hypothetical protein
MLGGYAVAGLIIAVTRWFVPNPRMAVAGEQAGAAVGAQPAAEPKPLEGDSNADSDMFAEAA